MEVEAEQIGDFMPASRDKSQRIAFVYSNLYQIYKKSKEEGGQTASTPTRSVSRPASSSHVLRVGDLKSGRLGDEIKIRTFKPEAPVVREYRPMELLTKRVETRAAAAAPALAPATARAPAPVPVPVSAPTPVAAKISPLVNRHDQSISALHAITTRNDSEVDDLKKNLETLNELHGRLKFMLGELEDLVKSKK